MRAYKTVNDSYIEPISFTVPRRAETFQSDIFPPATGIKPAVSAREWLDGKTATPSKIDLESIYEGKAPVEVASEYKPPAPTPAPAPAPAPVKKQPEPAPAPAIRSPSTITDQKTSISNMANKYQDNEESSSDNETSSFEEISRPAARTAASTRSAAPAAVAKPPSPIATQPKPSSPVKASPVSPTLPRTAAPAPTASSAGVEKTLEEIKLLLEQQTKIITVQSEKISSQSQVISQLAAEVETLKKRVVTGGAASQEQSERIRQLELELEEARS